MKRRGYTQKNLKAIFSTSVFFENDERNELQGDGSGHLAVSLSLGPQFMI